MKIIYRFLILIILPVIAGCGRDLNQAKRYSDMKSECDSIIAQANLVIKNQKAREDSLWKVRDNWIKTRSSEQRIGRIDRELADLVTITGNIEIIIKHLEAIKTFASVGDKVNRSLIYYKRTYVNYSTTIQVHDENIMIQEITDGLTPKKYISRFLPKDSK